MNVRWAKRLRETVDVRQEELEGFECIQLPVDAVMKRTRQLFCIVRSCENQ